MLAEAFCACDEQVRQAQAVLDERQVERSRTLAAFAITVGDDGTVANLMGLGEREVRLARRTVGKTDARDVAQELLTRPPQPANRDGAEVPAAAAPQHAQHAQETTAPLALALGQGGAAQPQEPAAEPEAQSPSPLPHQRRETLLPTPAAQTAQAAHEFDTENTVSWSPSMDSVLVWSWRSNLDLHTVAAELGLDLRSLLLRTQTLAEEGKLGMEPEVVHESHSHSHAGDDNQPGRHRRHYAEGYATFANTTAFPAYS
ncbi:hypothetical protein JFN87_15095 [Streptomyces bomunensis]|uniref:Uncharacterized protein n=1 Tax=Streptomyces montanisoli TaxID=2798581 RepID=A0A940RY51_9ACTN|nr:hypothetical protein [Streptomyces montanisoli]